MPVRVGDGISTDLSIRPSILHPVLSSRNINHPINDRMCNVHPLWSKLLAQAVRERSKRKLAGREGRHHGIALDRRGGTGEDKGGRMLAIDAFEEEWKSCLGEDEGSSAVMPSAHL